MWEQSLGFGKIHRQDAQMIPDFLKFGPTRLQRLEFGRSLRRKRAALPLDHVGYIR
jgi:hypothetical protein